MTPIKSRERREGKMRTIIQPSLFLALCFLLGVSSSFAQEFTARFLGDYGNVAVMEVTGNYDAHIAGSSKEVSRQIIATEFFRTHRDEYDFLIIFSNFDFKMPEPEAEAFYLRIKNDVRGIGLEIRDYSSFFGSQGKLQGMIDMGNVSKYVTDPGDPNFEQSLFILSHELLHRWGAHVRFKEKDGTVSTTLLSKDQSHWSFLLDSGASVLYGNGWQMKGEGVFASIAAGNRFGPLDLYLMGFYDRTRVPPVLLIDNPSLDASTPPRIGTSITGTPRWVTIEDVIAVEGEREPDASLSKRTFKAAFIFITRPGTFTGYELYGLENIRKSWETRFSILTDGLGVMDMALLTLEDIPANPGIPAPPFALHDVAPGMEEDMQCLVIHQDGDGTRFKNPSHTALAVNTLYKATVDPDLSVKNEDIAFIPASVSTLPTDVIVSAMVWNYGGTDVSQARVVLYDGLPSQERTVAERQIGIPGQSSMQVSFPVRITDGNQHRFYVSVDPENLVRESNESNNLAAKTFYPETTCDFEIRSSEILISPNPVDLLSDVRITARVTNRGTSHAYNVPLRYFIDEVGNRLDLATVTVDVPAGQTVIREITWKTTRAGMNLPITVYIDPSDSFQELSETNNRAVTYLTVRGSILPNLASHRRPW
jgi:hypothetical protein